MHALSIRGLVKTYATGYTAVRGIDLDVAEGDFFALLGPNGAGKSTTIGIVCSLINKTAGQVTVFGHDLDTDKIAAKGCIGLDGAWPSSGPSTISSSWDCGSIGARWPVISPGGSSAGS